MARSDKLYTRKEVVRLVSFALNEASLHRPGYHESSVSRIIDMLPQLNEHGRLMLRPAAEEEPEESSSSDPEDNYCGGW